MLRSALKPRPGFLHERPGIATVLLTLSLLALAGMTTPTASAEKVLATKVGKASYYGKAFHGRRTASGERFNSDHAVAAHPSWSFGTIVRVTNLANSRTTKVRIIDRGPSRRSQRRGIIIDLSVGSARVLGFAKQGITRVKLEVLKWGKKR